MTAIGTTGQTLATLEKHGFTIQKKYGQNFLIDQNVLNNIVSHAGIGPDDVVLEIGPGIGALTQKLAEAAGRVLAVEIDRMLIPVLEDTLSAYDNVFILHQDILKVDISGFLREQAGGRTVKVVANLPYYITTPVVMALLETDYPIESITIMVQTEVAKRMYMGPGTKDYGALSLAVQYYATGRIVMEVSPECFIPRPKVGSAVIRLDCRNRPPIEVTDKNLLFRIIRGAFAQRRKKLTNSIFTQEALPFDKEALETALTAMNLPVTIRGEALTLQQFAELTNRLAGSNQTNLE
ncbi:MAG: 16S rRNA (adenine(1518)-N(6)/adenine(1519)-N(6))-dimethyltransferase RsmA [Lachnospiraceae bacterium]|nr:16S rRNA (adenine(1518)-N(6)/adenine(1519)-N(6))-dimethyltransferase RsmA [Lachnospiraceae bacterium]MDY5742793.1 16S rRNA (adenine(1518)-N(6)/adenine(1519)-N(6))-dimethyltransferase RsmA [Lachnospiraceae bacterium]